MKCLSSIYSLLLAFCLSLPAYTQTNDALSTCLADSLNKKERQALAKWIFLSMTTHPELDTFSNASKQDIKESNQFAGQLFTRLLSVQCANELHAAAATDPEIIQKSFEFMGQIAMQALLSHQETADALSAFIKYTDHEKIIH